VSFKECGATEPFDGNPELEWVCDLPANHQGDHGGTEHSWPFNRCPLCNAEVIDTHECSEDYTVPEYGITGHNWARCTVVDQRLLVASGGDSIATGIGAVMAMGSPTIEEWYLNLGSKGAG
jgi:hypothetical protein